MLFVMLALLAAGVPIVFSIGLAAVAGILVVGPGAPWILIPNSMFNGMDSFPLMAVPFFILAGELMNRGGITLRLVRFAGVLVGHIRGGLAHANIVASMLFAGITGSALADTAAIGSILIPAMKEEGYDADFSAAVTASSSLIGPIIPPSITMVIFGVTAGVSIGGLFLAGFVPGILIGFGLMGVAYLISRRRGYEVRERRASAREFFARLKDALLALLMPGIILGGIFAGVMTPTESAAVAVFYALIVGMFVFRELRPRDLAPIFLRSGLVTAFIMLIVGVARIFSDLLAAEQIPQQLSQALLSVTRSPWLILLLINVFLLFVGCVMDTTAAIIILVPVLLPVAQSIGVDPLTFGIIMSINLIIGLATPPLGVCLFVASGIAKITVERLVLAIWPFLLVEIGVLFLITYVPGLAMSVPRFFGYLP
ncbi:MAG: TRAP transporter large permease [Candidatus Tectomicrobia bacterium]|nr:TRAP transporter large permease [Candidatus Tectomicrobia bacterium]